MKRIFSVEEDVNLLELKIIQDNVVTQRIETRLSQSTFNDFDNQLRDPDLRIEI